MTSGSRVTTPMRRSWLTFALLVCAAAIGPMPARADDSPGLELSVLRTGASAFPLVWKPYSSMALPPVNLRNGSLLAKDLAGGSLKLSLRDFLHLVVENNLDLLATRYNFTIAQVDILRAQSGQAARGVAASPLPAAVFAGAIGAGVSTTAPLSAGGTGGAAISTQGRLVSVGPRGIFDPTLNVNVSYDRLVNPLNTTKVAGVTSVEVPSLVLQTRLQQELPYGTSYSISVNLQRQKSTQTGLLYNPAFTSFTSLQVYQPLLNGFGLALTQRFVTLADNNTKIVREAFRSALNDTLANAANAYWDLFALREGQRVAAEAVAVAERQHNEDLERVDLGVLTPLDALTAESQLAAARVQLVTAETSVRQQEALLKTLISRESSEALDAVSLEPTEQIDVGEDIRIPSTRSSIATALAGRASIRQAQLALESQHIAEQYTRKNLLPVFSVYGQANVYGLAPGTAPAFRQLVRWAYPEYSFGFTWSLPVLNRAAQADDVRARLEAQQSQAALLRTRQQVTVQVENATASLAQNRARASASQRALVASRVASNGEEERLRFGISTPYRVMLAQRDLAAAESADVQARVNYAKSLVAYEVAVGSLLEHNGIDADQALRGTLWVEHR
jgi:outer membrane protein TolC